MIFTAVKNCSILHRRVSVNASYRRWLLDQSSFYSLTNQLDLKLTTELFFPVLLPKLSGGLYQCTVHEVVFALLLQPKVNTILLNLCY